MHFVHLNIDFMLTVMVLKGSIKNTHYVPVQETFKCDYSISIFSCVKHTFRVYNCFVL